ncbi:MAG TPA: hypothetical protein VKQ30_18330 [Ktedonobacterales bacterium]|nr:hypothetical protein [Ktedonobacterales bacterium]
MTQPEPTISDDLRAVRTLDVFYGMELGCSSLDLHRSGWTFLPAATECDPMALLFGQRPLLRLVAPVGRDGEPASGAVAAVTPELRPAVSALLRGQAPSTLFTPDGLRQVDTLLRSAVNSTITTLREAHVRIAYATQSSFRPYVGQWQEWIEPLDETEETDLAALGLLARHSGGVYVIRQQGNVAAYSGIRPHSPHVSEVRVRTEIEALRHHGLGRAVLSRSTRAVLASGRLPLYRCRAASVPGWRLAESLGYRPYAHALAYFAESS